MKVRKHMRMNQKPGLNRMFIGRLLPNLEMSSDRLNRRNLIIKTVYKLRLKDN